MRVAAKYSMDDVQRAIVRVINSLPSASGIARLAFIAEFPGHFYKRAFKEVFVQACSTDRRPSGHDLQPLMAFPHLVALMMHYREGIIQPNKAIWNEKAPQQSPRSFGAAAAAPRGAPSAAGGFSGWSTERSSEASEDNWLDEQIESLGLAPFLAVKG